MTEPFAVTTDGAGEGNSPAPSHLYDTTTLDARGRAILKAFVELLQRRPADPAVVFGQICSRLRRRLRLRRALLFVKTERPAALQSYALWEDGALSSGVLVTVPTEDSLLWELLETGCAKSYSPASLFNGNLIESKLTYSIPNGALALLPLSHQRRPVGLVALNSGLGAELEPNDPLLQGTLALFGAFLAKSPLLSLTLADA
ncbi:MAG TPA: hypothetical protein VLB27_03060, partial [candidate division Zixibacteria bacterium]|nr:hypothetical protein [candidate division Zixibacteria bacterium]